MYISHYRLAEKPFQINTDPRFLWLGETHKEALSVLQYGVMSHNGILVLTGDAGTGKTTLINALIDNLDSDVLVAKIVHSRIDLMGFFSLVSQAFHISERFSRVEDFLNHFRIFLKRQFAANIRVLLVIDEAHDLSREVLEHIRLLSNLELKGKNLINIFLIGQNELIRKLMSPKCRALRQRVTINYQLKPLSIAETLQYCLHRLKIAGNQLEIFSRKAIAEVYRFSKGYPRLINIICDRALIAGYAEGVQQITPAMVKECSQELRFSGEFRMATNRLFAHLNTFITGPYFKLSKPLSDKRTLPKAEGFEPAESRKISFSPNRGRNIKARLTEYIRTKPINGIISGFRNSGVRNTALATCCVALSLAWSLWYQGTFSDEPNLSASENSVMKPNLIASYGTTYHGLPSAKSKVTGKAESKRYANKPVRKSEPFELALKEIYAVSYPDNFGRVATDDSETLSESGPSKETETKTQVSTPGSPDRNRQDAGVAKPSPVPSKPPKPAFTIQVGAFLNSGNATKRENILVKRGYQASLVKFKDSKGRLWHTVRIGEYATRSAATLQAKDFSATENLDSIVRPIGRF